MSDRDHIMPNKLQTRPTTDTVTCYAAAPALLSTVDANNCRWYPDTAYAGWRGGSGSRGYYTDDWRQQVLNPSNCRIARHWL